MERKIDETFEFNGKHYQTVKSNSDKCLVCDFENETCSLSKVKNIIGNCSFYDRNDHNNVCFKLINMCKKETRTIELTLNKAKEWYNKGGELKEIALEVYKEDELEDYRSHSWEEFCTKHDVIPSEYIIDGKSNIIPATISSFSRNSQRDKNIYPSEEYAEASLALCQLLQLRQEWIGDWEYNVDSYILFVHNSEIDISISKGINKALSFPTMKMISEFKHDFKDLLEIAKPLL